MKKTIETELYDHPQVWGLGDVTHSPRLAEISMDKDDGWFIGQKVKVIIESIED